MDSRNRYPPWVEVSINVDVRQQHLSEPRQKHPCLQLRLNTPNPSLYILASCMLYFPLLIYSLHACLICIVNVKLVPNLHLNLRKLKNYNFGTQCLITPPSRHLFSRSYKWYQSIGLHCFGLITIGGRWMSLLLGVLDIECLFLMESIFMSGKMRCL